MNRKAALGAIVLATALSLIPVDYLPWWRQRQFHRSKAPIRCIVAGRQSGKTHCAAEEVVRIICQRPNTDSCLLMPTYKSTQGPLKHLRRALAPLGEGRRWVWREAKQLFEFWNGAKLYVRTADDKEGKPTRGLTIDGVLWVDEAAYVPRSAWDAARLTQVAVADPLVIITTTARGKNWVYHEFLAGVEGPKKQPLNESWRFRSTDSPFANKAFLADVKRKLGTRRAMQELNAHFLGDAMAAFDPEDISKIFVPTIKRRGKRLNLGADLGKEQDWTVITLMNEWGESWVVGRWRRVKWPDTEKRIAQLAEKLGAQVILDRHAGGGYGGALFDYLERTLGEGRVVGILTGSLQKKGVMIETLKSDIENHRIRVQLDDRGQVLYDELTFFEQHRVEAKTGKETWRYHGPETAPEKEDEDGDDETHDDCVISLALANYGRIHAWDADNPLDGDYDGWDGEFEAGESGGADDWGGFDMGSDDWGAF